ncbi:MAG TPA: hypothetical protein VIG99_05445 [Myxococcaceae bacterium]|jgi:hypothetical protein
MKIMTATALAAAALLFAGRAWAEDARSAARAEVLKALESQARAPDLRPTLPDQASDRAREVQSTISFGQKGAAQRAANQAAKAAKNDSAGAAVKKAAAAAADRASQKSQAAAGERRAEEVRQGVPPSRPNRGKP